MATLNTKPLRPYVVLADDDADDCMFFNEAFEELKLNLDLVTFCNGQEVLDFIVQEYLMLPQLIFLDLNMPMMNGLECLKVLKDSDKFNTIPVIIYSTSGSNSDIQKCMHAKAHLYIRKPNSFSHLKSVIHKVMVTDFVSHLTEPAKERFLVFSEDNSALQTNRI